MFSSKDNRVRIQLNKRKIFWSSNNCRTGFFHACLEKTEVRIYFETLVHCASQRIIGQTCKSLTQLTCWGTFSPKKTRDKSNSWKNKQTNKKATCKKKKGILLSSLKINGWNVTWAFEISTLKSDWYSWEQTSAPWWKSSHVCAEPQRCLPVLFAP